LKNQEKKIMKTCFKFFKNIPILKFKILGLKILIKGKIFKKQRKKIFSLKKGILPLMNPLLLIKYTKYFIITRQGTFSFHF